MPLHTILKVVDMDYIGVGEEVVLVPNSRDRRYFGSVGRIVGIGRDNFGGLTYNVLTIDPKSGEDVHYYCFDDEVIPLEGGRIPRSIYPVADRYTKMELESSLRGKVIVNLTREFPGMGWEMKSSLTNAIVDNLLGEDV